MLVSPVSNLDAGDAGEDAHLHEMMVYFSTMTAAVVTGVGSIAFRWCSM